MPEISSSCSRTLAPSSMCFGRRLHQGLLVLLLILVGVSTAPGQDVSFEALVPANNCTSLLIRDGLAIGGLSGGGLALWSLDDPNVIEQVTAGRDLSGNYVVDLAWTGAYVWVATAGSGLTRIDDIAGDRSLRQFTSVLGGLDLTAVTGAVVADVERVYYGIAGVGVGEVINGVGGLVYTVDQDGLPSNDINDLAMYGDMLFVATPNGVTRLDQGGFITSNDGLTITDIQVLAVSGDGGQLYAAGEGGAFRWDPVGEAWTLLSAVSNPVRDLVADGDDLWLLGENDGGGSRLMSWNGTSFDIIPSLERCYSLALADDLWLGGRWRDDDMSDDAYQAYLSRRNGDATYTTWTMNSSLFVNTSGVTFGSDGRLWMGAWNGDAVSAYDDDVTSGQLWTSFYEPATAENDSSGLFNNDGNVLCMATGTDGAVWFNQFFSGLVRYDPDDGHLELVYPGNSSLNGRTVVNVVVHPDGTLLIMHDLNDAGLVDVLSDPAHWRNSSNWSALPSGSPGLGNGVSVWDAVVERNDVIWFAVEDVGLVRWDLNGSAGPDDTLTWHDQSDDVWSTPVAEFPGSGNDAEKVKGLALAPDGTIWAGGNGLVRFSYDADTGETTVHESWSEKTSSFADGLVNGSVSDVVVDGNGDCWVASATGLNRIRTRGTVTTVDTWIDLRNFYGNSLYQLLYSPNVVAALPGISYDPYGKLAVDRTGLRVAVTADQGAALLSIVRYNAGQSDETITAYCYPNPVTPGTGDDQLMLGGIAADAAADDPATVEIYNLEGQLVYRDRYVTAGVGFWDGNNRYGRPVAAGVYLVRVTWRGSHAVHNLAVVR